MRPILSVAIELHLVYGRAHLMASELRLETGKLLLVAIELSIASSRVGNNLSRIAYLPPYNTGARVP